MRRLIQFYGVGDFKTVEMEHWRSRTVSRFVPPEDTDLATGMRPERVLLS